MDSIDGIIITSKSTAEAESRLEKAGLKFNNRKELLSLLGERWCCFRNEFLPKIMTEQIAEPSYFPEELPHLEVLIAQQPCKIYGVVHDLRAGTEYLRLVHRTIKNNQNWLVEQSIPKVLLLLPELNSSENVELPDHLVPNTRIKDLTKAYSKGVAMGFSLPLAFLFIRYLPPLLQQQEKQTRNLASFTLGYGLELTNALCRNPLPYYAELEEKGSETKPKYNPRQQRSGYMAEFLRQWKTEQPRNILTGAAHAVEIRYFVENGVKDQRIVEMAHRHAEIAQNDPIEFAMILNKGKQRTHLEAKVKLWGVRSPYILGAAYLLF